MESNENIDIALAALEQASAGSEERPAIIRLAPDSDAYVLGNRDGYVQLAIASLRAAQGSNQDFKYVPWVGSEELDWGLLGLKYDPNAHKYLRPPRKRRSWLVDKIYLLIAVAFVMAIFGTLIVGMMDIASRLKG